VVWLASSASAQTKRPTNEQWDHIRPLFKIVEEVAAGKPAPADVTLTWQCHFLNAEAGVVFVPFTLTFEPDAFPSFPLAMYLRVVVRGAPAPAPGPTDALAQYPFEDAAIFDRPVGGRITRAFTAPPGEYDVYVALSEMSETLEKQATSGRPPHTKTVVIKEAVNVPDLKSDLAVSSIIVADRIEVDAGSRRPNFEEQLDEPYAWWGTRITPAIRNTFRSSENLSLIFLIYNTGAAADDKPDVEVQYSFHRRTGGAETFLTFFKGTKPEIFSSRTLPREFSLARGDLLIAGQQIPLAHFPDGDYRLEIKVSDRTTGKSLTRDVNFTVSQESKEVRK
jgi:hypothetical protein